MGHSSCQSINGEIPGTHRGSVLYCGQRKGDAFFEQSGLGAELEYWFEDLFCALSLSSHVV
jgi:hypothetical protein